MSGATRVALGEVCEVVGGGTPSTSDAGNWNGRIAWATPKDLSELGERYISGTARSLSEKGLSGSGAKVLPPGSVLLSSRAPIGLVAINTVPMATNQGFKSLIPRAGRIDAHYLAWYLRATTAQLQAMGNGATFKEISASIVSKVAVPLPSIDEQRRTARVLDAADGLRAKRREALERMTSLPGAVLGHLLAHWNGAKSSIGPLSEVVRDIRIGPFGTALHKDDYVTGGVPVINPTHIGSDGIEAHKGFAVDDEKYAELSSYHLQLGDLILGRRGEMGRCAVVGEEHVGMVCGTGSMVIRPDPSVAGAAYLQGLLSSAPMRTRLGELSLGATMPNLNKASLGSLPIPVLPIELQDRYGRARNRAGASRHSQLAHLANLDALVVSLQARAFSGGL